MNDFFIRRYSPCTTMGYRAPRTVLALVRGVSKFVAISVYLFSCCFVFFFMLFSVALFIFVLFCFLFCGSKCLSFVAIRLSFVAIRVFFVLFRDIIFFVLFSVIIMFVLFRDFVKIKTRWWP
jgi:hypothetical protein